ncbi:hypothetical protein G0D86_29690 (plasmid) [Burkholderia multivorans]|uniref:hypothetical protein n=1 Tax=Burkholderia multivorans TaxID=87883 RepID=UPI0019CFC7D0|nr:hypothetical protein [Burkholderia multivorans]QSL63962.1 hypothetical protein G0D86_29690 [Burkholderia multivorans]
MDIAALNESARKIHGPDISFLVARAQAWGNSDNLILVSGKNRAHVAADLARAVAMTGKEAVISADSEYTKVQFD